MLFRKAEGQWRGRKRMLVFAGVLLLLGAVALWIAKPASEPSYQGKEVGEWLSYLQSTPHNELWARQAFQQMGTNAIPALLRRLAKSDSGFTVVLVKLKRKCPWLKLPVEGAATRYKNVLKAFREMGATNAQHAIPELIDLLKGTPLLYDQGRRPQTVAHILSDIGLPSVGPLIQALTNADPALRFHACYTLGEIAHIRRGAGEVAAPLCHVLRNDPYVPARCRAAIALARMTSQPYLCVPALSAALADSAAPVRLNAANTLVSFARDAQSAVPFLQQAIVAEKNMPERPGDGIAFTEKSKSQVLGALMGALKAIDPDAAVDAEIAGSAVP